MATLLGCCVNQETFKMKPYSTDVNNYIFVLRAIVLEQQTIGNSQNHFIKPKIFKDEVHQSQLFADYCTQLLNKLLFQVIFVRNIFFMENL